MTSSPRRAFTLIELLVVTGLMASFLGLLAVGMRPTNASQVRQLSQSLASAIVATQTRAIGNETGAALILDVAAGSTFTNSFLNGDVLPLAVGTVSSGMPPTDLSASSAAVSLTPTNADAADLATGYRIRFSGTAPPARTAWMGFSASGAAGTVTLREDASQTINNTVWPTVPVGSSVQFEVMRRPLASGRAADVTKLAAVDLRYSGLGNSTTGNFGVLSGRGSIGITFDRTGSLDAVILYGMPAVDPINPTTPLYLLLASTADIEDRDDPSKSLKSQTSRWLAIAPGTGRVSVAMNVPVSGTTEADVFSARANARRGVTAGVK